MQPHTRARGSFWGVSLVKNEGDIIVPVVEHLFRQGAGGILVADNDSTDDTRSLLVSLARRYPLYVAQDHEPGHYQGIKMDRLCDWVRRAGADWIIPFDADEFWFGPQGTLSQYFRRCRANIAKAQIHSLYPIPGVQFRQGPWRLEVPPHPVLTKVAFRSCRYSLLAEGNHMVRRMSPSRSGLRINRPGQLASGLRILHVPWRSYEQFRRKGLQGMEALSRTGFDAEIGYHWRALGALNGEAARATWNAILSGERVDDVGWSPGAPFRLVDPSEWRVWDPDGILASILHETPEAGAESPC